MAETRSPALKPKPAPAAHPPFDEQLWPVNLAIIVFAGFVAGGIIAISDFNDPRWFHNAWVRLVALVVGTGLLIAVATKLPSRRFRRAMQLAAVLSMLVHLGAMVVLYNQRSQFVDDMVASADAVFESPVELPDFTEPDPDQPQDFEKPVETAALNPETTVAAPQKETPIETPQENQQTPLPETTPQVEQNPVKQAELQEAAPRRAEEQSRFSKQTAKAAARDERIETPPAEELAPDPASEMNVSTLSVERTAVTKPGVAQPNDQPEISLIPQQQAMQIAKRDAPETPPTDSPSIPTLNRQLNQPLAVPRIDADAPQPVAVNPDAIANGVVPNSVAIQRQTTAPNIAREMAEEPTISAAPEVSKVDSAPQQASETPQLASGPQATQAKAAAEVQAPAMAVVEGPPAAVDSPNEGALPGPAVAQISRGEAQAPVASNVRAVGDTPSAAPATIVGMPLDRAERSDSPSILPQAAPTAHPNRATQVADVAASPTNIDSPVAASQEGAYGDGLPAHGEASPAGGSIAKGSAGVAGIGHDLNLGAGDAASPNSTTVAAAASATRAEASQLEAGGPALNSNAPAQAARALAGTNAAAANVAAAEVGISVPGGEERSSGNSGGAIEASANTSIARGNGSAKSGLVTAAAGIPNVEAAAPQIVTSIGGGRGTIGGAGGGGGGPGGGAGGGIGGGSGGVPTVPLDQQGVRFSRQPSGGAPISSIAAQAVADAPQAPAGDGGGGPTANLESSAAGVARSSAGGLASVNGAVGLPGAGPTNPGGGAIGGGGSAVGAPGGIVGGGATVGSVTIGRAENGSDAMPGPTAPGGTLQPGRAVGRAAFAEVKADVPVISAGPSVGQPSLGAGVEARGDVAVKSAAGLPGRTVVGPVGAVAGEVPMDTPIVGSPGSGLSQRRGAPSNEAAPAVAAVGSPGVGRKTNFAGVPQGQAGAIEVPEMAGGPAGGVGTPGGNGEPGGALAPLQPGLTGVGIARSPGAIPVQVAALEGPGGFGLQATPDVGSMSRQARRDSEVAHTGSAARFLNRTVGGPLSIDGRAREATQAFSRRHGKKLDPSGEYGVPMERTEDAVEMGLGFLLRHQSPDGSWSLERYGLGKSGYEKETSQLHSDTAATGLALLAFLGAGYDHYDDQYQTQIRQGLAFLLKNQKPDGDLYLPMDGESNKSVWLYSHGIATIALCEAFGMTGDADLREPAQKAIDFIVASQDPKQGGWRYTPGRLSDTSVSGWQLMALKSGELAGLNVPKETYKNVEKWLNAAEQTAGGKTQYAYDPFAPDMRNGKIAGDGRKATPATTSMGLLMRLYMGWNRNDPRLKGGVDFLLQNPPQMGSAAQPMRDSYYWYYGTQLMFHMKGDYWKRWNEKLHPALVDQQIQTGTFAGSWDPKLPIADRWGHLGGRMYVTTLNLLSLEVYYRHLPIYEQEAK